MQNYIIYKNELDEPIESATPIRYKYQQFLYNFFDSLHYIRLSLTYSSKWHSSPIE